MTARKPKRCQRCGKEALDGLDLGVWRGVDPEFVCAGCGTETDLILDAIEQGASALADVIGEGNFSDLDDLYGAVVALHSAAATLRARIAVGPEQLDDVLGGSDVIRSGPET